MTMGVQWSKRGYNTQVDEIVGGAVPAQSMTGVIEVRIEHTGDRRWGFIRPRYVKCGYRQLQVLQGKDQVVADDSSLRQAKD
jgi:hypothetical protein